MAGYANHTAAVGKSKLVRETAGRRTRKSTLQVSAIQKGKKPDVALLPDDVVYIPFSFMRNIGVNGQGILASAASAAIYIHYVQYQESILAAAQSIGPVGFNEDVGRLESPDRGARKYLEPRVHLGFCCCCCSTLPSTASLRLSMSRPLLERWQPVRPVGFLPIGLASW